MNHEWHRDGYSVSTDPARLDLDVIHGFLSRCYWAEGIPLETVRRSIEHSLNFGVYLDGATHGAEAASAAAAPGVEAVVAAAPRKVAAEHAAPQVGFARVITTARHSATSAMCLCSNPIAAAGCQSL